MQAQGAWKATHFVQGCTIYKPGFLLEGSELISQLSECQDKIWTQWQTPSSGLALITFLAPAPLKRCRTSTGVQAPPLLPLAVSGRELR